MFQSTGSVGHLGDLTTFPTPPLSLFLLSAFLTVYFWSLFKTTLFVTWNWTHFWYCERRHFFSRYNLQYQRLSIDSLKKVLTPWYGHPDPYTFLCRLVTSGLSLFCSHVLSSKVTPNFNTATTKLTTLEVSQSKNQLSIQPNNQFE